MASQGEGSQKWKRKRMLEAKAERMRAAKQARLQETHESSGRDDEQTRGSDSGRDDLAGPSSSRHTPEPDDDGPRRSESENDRDSESSSSESDFNDEKAQSVFNDWMVSLPALNRKTLAVLLMESFRNRQKMNVTDAAKGAASITGYNEKTVRQYRKEFFTQKGKFKEGKQGKYKRHCLLNDENLRLEAAMYVRENAYRKGEANMTATSFCQWVNNDLLPSYHLPPNLPRTISLRTATRWLHKLGFRPQSHKKGAYVDGHEREDVVKSREEFLKKLKELKETHLPPPPCSDERAATPPPDAETRKKLILIYHDESIFNTNEGQTWMWAGEDAPIIQPKTKGSGIMVSDFVDAHSGFLELTDSEHDHAKATDPDFPKTARALLEYGADKEGYWTSEKFMANIEVAAQIAEFKYPSDKHTIVWLFDQSSCHRAFAEDALNAKVMNVRPGGVQPRMRDTMWAGKVQKMIFDDGTPKGMKRVLEERGINTSRMVGEDMRTVLSWHDDFKNEKTIVEHYLNGRGHIVLFIPKFHCELNPIERVWGQAKVYSRKYSNFTVARLRQIVNPALDSVSTELIRKYFRKIQDYETAYLEGKKAGKEL